MDIRLFVSQLNSVGLTLINPRLYSFLSDGSAVFHDQERYELFWIRLNEFINTKFDSPLDRTKTTLFDLTSNFFRQYMPNEHVAKFMVASEVTRDFFFRPRYYRYYLSPHVVAFETSLSELIGIQANYSKHSLYRLSQMKARIKGYFKAAGVASFETEDYDDHLEYFKEAVLDDRLELNQTLVLEQIGKYFLALWDLLHAPDRKRIDDAVWAFIAKHGRTARWVINEPPDMSDLERFYWQIKGGSHFERGRIADHVPQTPPYLVEPLTSPANVLDCSG
jgi:hypothetical protein